MFKRHITLVGLLTLLGSLFIAPWTVSGAEGSSSRQAYATFFSSAETLYDAVNKGNLELALHEITDMDNQFRKLPLKEITTTEGIHALASSIIELKRTAASISPNERKWKSGAATLKLAADVLAHPDKPIWHTYWTVLNEDITKLRSSIPNEMNNSSSVPDRMKLVFEQLAEHYHVIRTAALLQVEPWKVERSDSVMRYASRIYQAESPTAEQLLSTISPLQEALQGLFPGNVQTSTALVPPLPVTPPSWGWSAMIGSFIVTILTWVGWKRYNNDEPRVINPHGNPPPEHRVHR